MPEPNSSTKGLEKPDIETLNSTSGSRGVARASLFVSIAAVLVPLIIGGLGVYNAKKSQDYDEKKSDREFGQNCVSSGAKVADMAFALSKGFKELQEDEKINYVNIIIASFPPDTARRFLAALSPLIGSKQEVLSRFQVARDNVEKKTKEEKEKHEVCPDPPELIPGPQPIAEGAAAVAPPGPVPTAQLPDQTRPPSTSQPVPARQLAVYYQVTEEADRDNARRLAKDIDDATKGSDAKTAFAEAGVQVVEAAATLKQTEVRYYRRSEQEAATELKELLEKKGKEKQLVLDGKIVYLGNRYPNLPPGRIEVWFQPLTPRRG